MLEYYCSVAVIVLSFLIHLSTSYKILTLEDPSLCSPIVKRRIKLGLESQSGLIVSVNSLKDHSIDWDKNFFCKFQVEVTKNNRIFAVIQNLSFRQNLDTNECIDFVHLKRADGTISKQFCGNISAIHDMDSNNYINGNNIRNPANAYDDYTGQLDVNIQISKQALMFNEMREFQIVFTSYRQCHSSLYDDESCGAKEYSNCIYKGFIKDGYINCPYFDCVDERGCAVKPMIDDSKKSVGNKVIISTVSVLFIAFVIFICFIWLCRKYHKLCWAEDFSTPSNARSQRPAAVIEMSRPTITDRASATVTTTESAEEDKDLPPSYETLFPNR